MSTFKCEMFVLCLLFLLYMYQRDCVHGTDQSQEPIKIMCIGQSQLISNTKNIKCMLEKVENYSKAPRLQG